MIDLFVVDVQAFEQGSKRCGRLLHRREFVLAILVAAAAVSAVTPFFARETFASGIAVAGAAFTR
jgi:hypothetical protein